MKICQQLLFCAALALLVLLPAVDALAMSVSGRASTELEWYDNAEEDTAIPLYQYLLAQCAGSRYRGAELPRLRPIR